ncbi:DUF1648 domain-containing protein [Streptomyces yangpuensis]|uniref:DUF1648 domain-containing protein n=1 Tax=Streptomyces yangpuensis TaxID=1648182 RepID=A0ABY5Q447_9ACTN|nr:DUF1648 domain-containing protein [Streptomyces yangpuensis]MBZ9599625.1 DUF1648 domain-containing protein [Streptomyces erythrochromogenes]UUY51196.1 DUF1648 domain-containing protein [Streptomyces yangpuensis]
MTDRMKRPGGGAWGAAVGVAGVFALLTALPLAASGRLPERVATHWGGAAPDGSMPVWAASVFPALIWAVPALCTILMARRTHAPAPSWAGAALAFTGIFMAGTQASIVRANLDRADWREAGAAGLGIALTFVAALTAGALGWITGRRGELRYPAAAAGASLEIPAGQHDVWLSRTTNPWLHLVAAVTGVAALAAALAAAGGLLTGTQWAVVAPFALASVLTLAFSSVQARVTEKGLEVAFGPLGRPTRSWAPQDIESSRAESRTPAQVGGWGYRLSGLGTTVMLRSGECLVIRPRKGAEFAVSVDDAERGAALLNTLSAGRPGQAVSSDPA